MEKHIQRVVEKNIQSVNVFKTSDGLLFHDMEQAVEHENNIGLNIELIDLSNKTKSFGSAFISVIVENKKELREILNKWV